MITADIMTKNPQTVPASATVAEALDLLQSMNVRHLPVVDDGGHHYVFKLYALDTRLEPRGPLTKAKLLNHMNGHVLEEAELVGTYKRAA